MSKKLTEDKIEEILETGIFEFAEKGLDKANINIIAKKAGISVGALYHYYDNKENFFLACLKRCLKILNLLLLEQMQTNDKILVRVEKLIRAVQKYSRDHSSYITMYNEITSCSSKKYAPMIAREIESFTSGIYTQFISDEQEKGSIRKDINPNLFAFFFDSLLMSMHFSYCCDYYKERFKIFCGDDILHKDELVVTELLKFFKSAFTVV